MKRFHLTLIVRENDPPGPEFSKRCNVTAATEHAARRMALEQAWHNNYLVSDFIEIAYKELNR